VTVVPHTHPDYKPSTWALGYLKAQYGHLHDPAPTGTTGDYPPSIYAALANPPASMTTALLLPIPDAPGITPLQ
jgi:hypothetical protein